jgi:hypothetical protein
MKWINQTQRILALLVKGKEVTNRQLNGIAFRYGARLKELRDKGYEIETIRKGLGYYSYKLIKKPK